MTDFAKWLDAEIKKQDLSFSEIAKRSKANGRRGISYARISQVVTAGETAGPDFCIAVARGLNLDPVLVLRKADILPPAPGDSDDPALRECWRLLNELSPSDLDCVLRQLRGLAAD